MLTNDDLQKIGEVLDKRFSEQADLIQAGFQDVNERIDILDFRMKVGFRETAEEAQRTRQRFDRVETKIDGLYKLYDVHDAEIESLTNRINRYHGLS